MESALLVLALAYARYCEPLQPHVREVVETAMSKLTPDQRWNIERSAGESFLFRREALATILRRSGRGSSDCTRQNASGGKRSLGQALEKAFTARKG
jgi:hypothetical protein